MFCICIAPSNYIPINNNNIRIFPIPTTKGMYPEEWRIGICLGPYKKGEKPNVSPNVYTVDNIYEEIARMKKYYYDKYRK